MNSEGFVKSSINNGLGQIEFYHPAHNSLPGNLLQLLEEKINQLGADESVKVIWVKSEGDRTFCAGASFNELSSIQDKVSGKSFFMGFANVINAIRKSSKLVLMSVQGKAVGGGVGLAAAADYCLATKWSSIRLSELAVGIGPFVIGPAVVRQVGSSAFRKLALTPDEWQTAQWAKEKGLFDEVFDSKDQMDAYREHLVAKLLSYNPAALSQLKNIFWEGTDHWDELLAERAEISGELVLSKASKDAINQFLQA